MTRSTKHFALAVTFAIGAFLWPKQKDQLYSPRSGWFVTPAGDTLYYLVGKRESYQLLYQAVSDPDNTTNNQRKSLESWISSAQMVPISDTTKKK